MNADTVVAVMDTGALDHAVSIATLFVTLVLAVLIFISLLFLRQVSRIGSDLHESLKDLRKDAAPVMDRGRAVMENVEYMSNVIRRDFERLQEHVEHLGERLGDASAEMEARIQEFNALVEVVQGEAEDLILDAAATVKGVRTGAEELAHGSRRLRASGEMSSADPDESED